VQNVAKILPGVEGYGLYGAGIPGIKKVGFSAVFINIAHSNAYYEMGGAGAGLGWARVPATAVGAYVKVSCIN
jgi:hypothetical protein